MSSSAAAAVEAAQKQSIRRDSFGENNGVKLGGLPPRVVIGPDENGVRKVIEYRFDKAGNMVKIETIISPCDAVMEGAGSRLSVAPARGILLERPPASGDNVEGPLSGSISSLPMACKICSTTGDHWTSKCPIRALQFQASDGGAMRRLCPAPVLKKTTDKNGNDVRRIMYDDRTVRVTNLSKDTTEPGLKNLFQAFGYVTNVYIPMDGKTPVDGKTGSGTTIGFVKYSQRQEAEAAIMMLSGGYTYDNSKLQVGWAAPRVN